MSEVRLVRCPKCDKVLPEPFGIPVYQCGGCGALLRAKNKSLGPGEEKLVSSTTDSFDNKSIVKRGALDMAGKSPARSMVGESNGSKSPFRESVLPEYYEGLPKSPMRDRFLDDLARREIDSRNVSRSPMKEGMARSMDAGDPESVLRCGLGSEVRGNGEHGRVVKMAPKGSYNDWQPNDNREGQPRDNYVGEPRRTWRDRAEDRSDQFSEGVESVFSDEHGMTSEGSFGNSDHGGGCRGKRGMYKDVRSDYVGGYARQNDYDEDRSSFHSDPVYGYDGRRQSFENTRGPASVHKLQVQRAELLRKYNDLKDQLSDLDDAEVSSQGFYSEPGGYHVDDHSRHVRGPMQQFPLDRNVPRPNFSHGQIKRGPYSNQHMPKHEMTGYVPGRSLDFEQDRFESHVNDTYGHHPSCDCSLCYSNNWQDRDRHSSLPHKTHGTSVSSHSDDLERRSPQTYDPRMTRTSPRVRSSYPGLHRHSKSVDIARLCRPISGGAPFVLCNNCFQLLKLPGNFIAKNKNQQQLQCGACSTVVSFHLQHVSSDSSSSPKKINSVDVIGGLSEERNDLGPKHRHDSFATTSTDVGSDDFDARGVNFQSIGSEASKQPKEDRNNSSSTENMLGFTSSPSRFSVDEHLSDTSAQSSKVNSSEMPVKIRPPPGSPLRNHLDNSSKFNIPQDAENQIIDKDSSQKGPSVVSDATETEFPSNELPTSFSLDSEDNIPRDHMNDKPVQSPRIAEVYVNGQPISQRAVKRAEKLAGKIQPGEYWYDPKAGFWGVMGNRCLGIIPPSIQEFSIPLAENCSRGDSSVYVNGRELQTWDLDLLASRGLPITRDKHYLVGISGKVLDEQTRDFVVNLGRLAPSVERNKRGFGMQVPEQLYD